MSLVFCRLIFIVAAVALSARFAWTQQHATTPEVSFETASIRPVQERMGCFSILPPGSTHYEITCVTLRNLIAIAWKLHPDNIQGGDASALNAYYDLRATTHDGQPWTPDAIPPMLRQLLTDRFHVAVHRGTKQVSGYSLVVAKGGSKLTATESDSAHQGQKAGESSQNYILEGYIHGRGVNMGTVASLLASPAHATVVDRTGISGVFNIDLHFAYENGNDTNLPDFFTAVEEQLGLKLRAEKVTIDTLVIDHTDSEPTPN